MAPVLNSFLSLFSRRKNQSVFDPDDRDPTPEEWDRAKATLNAAARPASFGKLGGFRPPDPNDRFSSWWGGNFLALPGEDIPACTVSGRSMLPIFQLRVDELPYVPEHLEDIALMTLWFDPETDFVWQAGSGTGFTIRSYPALDDLVPLGLGYKEHPTMPTFPIKWHGLEQDLPDWEAFSDEVITPVARSDKSDWFFGHPARIARSELQREMPIKMGGHSQWWQSPQYVEGGEFTFFLDSTARGNFGFPGGGNANFFKTKDSWEMRGDFL